MIKVGDIVKITGRRPEPNVLDVYIWVKGMDKYMEYTAMVTERIHGTYFMLSVDGGRHLWHETWISPAHGEIPDTKRKEK